MKKLLLAVLLFCSTLAFAASPPPGAPLNSPAFTGTPTAPTATVGTNTTQLATTAFVLANGGGGGGGVSLSGNNVWTGTNLFSGGLNFNGGTAFTPNPTAPGFFTLGGGVGIDLYDPAGTVDARRIDLINGGGVFAVYFIDDAVNNAVAAFTASGTAAGGVTDVVIGSSSATMTTINGTMQVSGAITAQAGIAGVTTGAAPAAGLVGEVIEDTQSAVNVSGNTNCSSPTLTAGNWLVGGSVAFAPAGTTTVQVVNAGISITSANTPSAELTATAVMTTLAGDAVSSLTIPPQYIKTSSPLPLFLVVSGTFSSGTLAATCHFIANRIN